MFRFEAPSNPIAQLFLAIVIALFICCLLLFISIPIAYYCFGPIAIDFVRLANINDPEVLSVLKFQQIVTSIGLFVIPPLVIAYFFSGSAKSYLQVCVPKKPQQLLLAVVIAMSIMPIINLLAVWNGGITFPDWLAPLESKFKSMEQSAENVMKVFLNIGTLEGLLINIFMIAVIPAIGEELTFRGIFQKLFIKITGNAHWGIIISAFLFSAIHLQFYGFFPRWALGIVLGYLFLWSGSIWLPILAHFINNAVAVIGYYMENKGNLGKETLEVGSTPDMLIFTILSTVLFLAAFYYYYRLKQSAEVEFKQVP